EVVGRVWPRGPPPGPHGVAEEDVALQLLQAAGRDGDVLELPEAGGDAVLQDRASILLFPFRHIAGGDRLDLRPARLDAGQGVAVDLHRHLGIAGEGGEARAGSGPARGAT